jgi:hypothetical protein
MAHELRNMTMDSHVTLPSLLTMTFVLIDDLYDDTSALKEYDDIKFMLDYSYGTLVLKPQHSMTSVHLGLVISKI